MFDGRGFVLLAVCGLMLLSEAHSADDHDGK